MPVRRSRHCRLAQAWTRARSRGSLTGVRTALLPLIHATRAPTQGTALLQVSPLGSIFLTLSCTVTCWRPWWYVATCSTRWPRSVGCRDLRLVGVQWVCLRSHVSAFVLLGYRSSLRWLCASFFSPVSSPRWNLIMSMLSASSRVRFLFRYSVPGFRSRASVCRLRNTGDLDSIEHFISAVKRVSYQKVGSS